MQNEKTASGLQATSVAEATAPPGFGTLFVFDLAQPIPPLELPSEIICRKLKTTEGHYVQQAMDKAGNYQTSEADYRLEKGRAGYVVELAGEVACYGWVSPFSEQLGDTGCAFTPPAGDVWLYDFATVPEFRGRGYYPLLLRYILAELKSSRRYAWIGTAPGNDTSSRSIAKAGFTKAAHTRYLPATDETFPQFEVTELPGLPQVLLDVLHKLFISCV